MLNDETPLSIDVYPTAKSLLRYQHVDKIASFVNDAYHERNKERLRGDRVRDTEDLIAQFGENSLVVLVSSPASQPAGEPTLIALGAARPFVPPTDITVWSPRIPPDEAEEFERWELKIICTNPVVKPQGYGVLVMDMLELAIKRRIRAQQSKDPAPRRKPQIVLSAVDEVAGDFYRKRGFVTCCEVYVGKGERYGRLATEPNREEFHVISMTKML